ncbi:MAG: hypothetical protein R3F43_20945 [bacterium]
MAALAEAEPRARAGRFVGEDGAFAALDHAEDLGYLGGPASPTPATG